MSTFNHIDWCNAIDEPYMGPHCSCPCPCEASAPLQCDQTYPGHLEPIGIRKSDVVPGQMEMF